MGKALFLLFTIVPVVELWLFMQAGAFMGFGGTLAVILITGALGAFLARAEGLRVLKSWQSALAEGRLPEDGVVSSLLVLVGGVLLVTPGMLTDVSGFLLLLPPSRRIIAAFLVRFAERRLANPGTASFSASATGFSASAGTDSAAADFAAAAEGAFSGDAFQTQKVSVADPEPESTPRDFVGYAEKDNGEVILMPPLDSSKT